MLQSVTWFARDPVGTVESHINLATSSKPCDGRMKCVPNTVASNLLVFKRDPTHSSNDYGKLGDSWDLLVDPTLLSNPTKSIKPKLHSLHDWGLARNITGNHPITRSITRNHLIAENIIENRSTTEHCL